jgi:Kef-type K+ transport system membrane component KefB
MEIKKPNESRFLLRTMQLLAAVAITLGPLLLITGAWNPEIAIGSLLIGMSLAAVATTLQRLSRVESQLYTLISETKQ